MWLGKQFREASLDIPRSVRHVFREFTPFTRRRHTIRLHIQHVVVLGDVAQGRIVVAPCEPRDRPWRARPVRNRPNHWPEAVVDPVVAELTYPRGVLKPQPADVVVANILANPLRLLAPLLTSLVRPGGALVLSGLLERQADELCALYPQVGLQVFAQREGWACLAGVRH